MEQLSLYIADRMAVSGVISEEDKEFYCYSVQVLIEKFFGFTLIFAIALYFHILLQVVAFLFAFTMIRRFSDGYHCKTSFGCLCSTMLICLTTPLFVAIIDCDCATRLGGGGFVDGSIVHNSNIRLSQSESDNRGVAPP